LQCGQACLTVQSHQNLRLSGGSAAGETGITVGRTVNVLRLADDLVGYGDRRVSSPTVGEGSLDADESLPNGRATDTRSNWQHAKRILPRLTTVVAITLAIEP